jgi:hypothetical protein
MQPPAQGSHREVSAMRTLARSSLVLIAITAAVGCASPVKVLKEAAPNPFTKNTAYTVDPIEYVSLTVDGKPEAQFLARKSDETDKWEQIKVNTNSVFRENFETYLRSHHIRAVTQSEPSDFHVRPTVGQMETGYYRIPAWNAVARIFMNVKVVDPAGQVVEEFEIMQEAGFDAITASTTNIRLSQAARRLGSLTAGHLVKRSQ